MVATVYKARVWEMAVITGTGAVTVAGSALPGYRSFASCVPSGSLVAYDFYDATAQAWETGIGTFTVTTAPAGTITRGLSESSTGSLIDFEGNPCNVTLVMLSPVQTSAGAASAGLIPALNAEGQIDPSMGGSSGTGVVQLVSVQTISGAASVQFIGLQAGFDYYVVGQNILNSVVAQPAIRFGVGGSSPTWDTGANYQYNYVGYENTGTGGNATTTILCGPSTPVGTLRNMKFDILGGVENVAPHSVFGYFEYTLAMFAGNEVTVQAVSAVEVYMTAGTISGTFYLYSIQR